MTKMEATACPIVDGSQQWPWDLRRGCDPSQDSIYPRDPAHTCSVVHVNLVTDSGVCCHSLVTKA